MLIIGLTGGVGSGKSTVARQFAALGVPVIDADEIARELVAPGQPALQAIARRFGREVLDARGRLRRDVLRRRIFDDAEARRALEAILHPRIRDEIRRRLATLHAPCGYALVVIPLLLESGWQDLVQRILVVDCPESLQIARTMARDGIDRAQAEAMLAAQVDHASRLAAADDVIHNEGEAEALAPQVAELHRRYCALARGQA